MFIKSKCLKTVIELGTFHSKPPFKLNKKKTLPPCNILPLHQWTDRLLCSFILQDLESSGLQEINGRFILCSDLHAYQRGLQPRLRRAAAAPGLGLCLASMPHWLPKPWWGSERPNTVLVVDAPPPTSVSAEGGGGCGGGGGGTLSHCQQQLQCDKGRRRRQPLSPRSGACIIVVVAKCSWLIIPPSFANEACRCICISMAASTGGCTMSRTAC